MSSHSVVGAAGHQPNVEELQKQVSDALRWAS
jgi:hypothetical protein